MSWLERLGSVIRAELNSLNREAADPEKILEQAVMAMEQELIEMRRALAEALATSKSSERQLANYNISAEKWYERAQLALDKDNEVLARDALSNRQSYLVTAQSLQGQLNEQKVIINQVKQDLRTLEHKYAEAKAKKSLYIVRLRSAVASQKLEEIAGNLNKGSSWSVFEQMEAKILEIEAQSELTRQSTADPLEQKFAALEGGNLVDTELARMKAKRLNPSNEG